MNVREVPVEVRGKASALGDDGRRWLEGLDELVARLEREWGVRVGATIRGGSESYVAEATTREGERAVLKLALPGRDVSHEIATLRHAGGNGYVRLLRSDDALQAMLQERLGAPLTAFALPFGAQLDVICATLLRAWEVPPEPSFRSGADKAAWLSEFIAATWHELGEPCPAAVIEHALACAQSRLDAFDPATAVLVHGDAHPANTLQHGARFKLIDPDGLFAERACDLAVPMREHGRELLDAPDALTAARDRCDYLARACGVDARAIWEWGVMERVSTGLLALRTGRGRLGAEMLAVATALARA